MASIAETAVQAGSFKTLCAAVEAAGLMDALKGRGSWTLLAPNDEAFSKLPPGTVDSLLADIPKLQEVLMYHVIRGRFTSDDIMEHEQLPTVQGQNITIDTSRGMMVNNANVIQTDIECDNGVIHVVDSVLMPKVESRIHQP